MIDADRMAEIRRLARPCLCPPHQAVVDLLEVIDGPIAGLLNELYLDDAVPMHHGADIDQFATEVLGLDVTKGERRR